MCWPILIVAAIAAVGAYQQSATKKATSEYQSKVAANNAQVAEWQAADAKERGDVAAAGVRRKYAALQGTQVASLAARGLDISEGSANAILTDTDFFGSYDQNVTRANAAREAWGFKVRAGNFQGDAAAYSASADAENPLLSGALAGSSAYFGMGGGGGKNSGSLLASGGAISDRWYS